MRHRQIRDGSTRLRARCQLQGSRLGQPLRRGHQLFPVVKRGQPGAHNNGERDPGRRPPARSPGHCELRWTRLLRGWPGGNDAEDACHRHAHRSGCIHSGLEVQGDRRNARYSALPRRFGRPPNRTRSWSEPTRRAIWRTCLPRCWPAGWPRAWGTDRSPCRDCSEYRTSRTTVSEALPAPRTAPSPSACPSVTVGTGTVAGAAIYAAGHGTALPLLRVQEPPWRLPRAAFAWELTSHLLFGLVLEIVRRNATSVAHWATPSQSSRRAFGTPGAVCATSVRRSSRRGDGAGSPDPC